MVSLNISGQVTNGNLLEPEPGVEIDLGVRGISDGTFNNNFQTIESTTSSVDGTFNFSFENENLAALRMRFEKESYFSKEVELTPEDIDIENGINIDVEMFSVAQINVTLENTSPINESDNIEFRFTNANFDCTCCSNEIQTFTGTDIDTTLSCFVPGDYNLNYLYIVTKGPSNVLDTGSITVTPGINELTIDY